MRRLPTLLVALGVAVTPGLARAHSLWVASPFEAQVPLTKRLQEAFGDNHDVVGETAFINTLMDGKLTKPQWIDHLQQRALIHEEIDRQLGADPNMPYGEAQKQVTVLLRKDLTALGAAWPGEDKAWKLTKEMVDEMKAKGPYFTLGVWHVYYGGITHGGRQIGAIAAKAVGTDTDYYLKSDGYRPYAAKVNQITDPEAQRLVIEGGLAAYRYIIASNNDERFKTK